MDAPGGQDYPRVGRSFVAGITERHIDLSKVKEFEASISDLGEGGVFIDMPDPPPKGTILEVELNVPDRADKIKVLAIVRWREKAGRRTGVGVRLAPIGRAERTDLAGVVRTATREERAEAGAASPDEGSRE